MKRELRHPDAERRLRAAEALARAADRLATLTLAESLLDEDERVRRVAASAFRRLGPGMESSLELLDALRRERDRASATYH